MTATAVGAPALALPPSLEDGILIWDPLGVILDANEAMARMVGVPVDILIGAPADASVLRAPGGGMIRGTGRKLFKKPVSRVAGTSTAD